MDRKRLLESVTTIFFDLDNTLIPTRKGDEISCKEVAKLLSEQYSIPKITANSVTNNFLEHFRKCPHNPDVRIDEWRISLWESALGERYNHIAKEVYVAWLSMRYEYLAPDISVTKMLKQLRKNGGYNLALISNGTSEAQWEKITILNLANYFDLILVSGDLPWEKPNIKIFHKACNMLKVNPINCVMVGDKIDTDIMGAIAAGLASTFLIKLKYQTLDISRLSKCNKPKFVLDNVVELQSYLKFNKSSCVGASSNSPSALSHSTLFYVEEDSNISNSSDGS